MPKAEFTQHQKLLVYFRPFHFKTNEKGDVSSVFHAIRDHPQTRRESAAAHEDES